MAITEVLRLLVEADMKGAITNVERFGDTSEREISKSEKALDRWGNRLTSVGAGMVGFGVVALTGLKSAGDAASDLNEVASKSATVFGSAGDEVDQFASNAAKIGLSKRAALEAASGFGNLFDQLGFANDASADMSMSLTGLASDFASFHNADISEVIEAQTAAFRGEYDAVQRFVPTINAAAVQQQAMADTGKESADALTDAEKAAATYKLMIEGAGAATGDFARTSDSAANQQRILNANWENLKAQLGQGVLPAMQTFLGITNKAVSGLSDLNAVSNGTVGKIATFGAVGITAAGGISMIVGQAIKMRENLSTAADAVSTVTGKLGGLKGIAGIAAGAAGIAGLAIAIDEISGGANKLSIDLDTLAASLDDTTRAGRESLEADIRKADSADVLDELVKKVADENFVLAESLVDVAEKMDLEHTSAGELRDIIATKRDEDIKGAVASEEHAEAVRDGADAMGEQADKTSDAEDALKDYQDTLKGTFDPLFAMDNALADNQEAQAELRTRQLEAMAAQEKYNDAVARYGENSKSAREAAAENLEAQNNLAEAQRTARSAVIDLESAAANLRFEMEENGLTAEEAREQFIEMATRMGYTREEAGRLALAFGLDTQKAQELGRQRPRPHVSTTGATAARNALASVRDTMHSIPTEKNIHIGVSVGAQLGQVIAMLAMAGGRARGGPVAGGRLYEVVEEGRPEVFTQDGRSYLIPSGDGYVTPIEDAQLAMAGAGSRGGVVHVYNYYINGSLLSERAVTRDLNRLTRKGRGLN